ncbi:cell envelope integrity protein TolA [Pseudomonas stutzeri]|jgi:colicin import membrane protein|uniref:Cell envelope integrity protein TolA n=1 Tax=Stutzerimonas stutzeri TaxID=316 RepID=A0A2N8SPM2_STUST|nr:cell envelope integrity protein TolA [Stutzerimonas stutzeri]EQM75062.1 cell envelope biogenesis protein TolA [Stutzerimonas stutzeri MF28]MCI0918955.1 cell envelope integrity protein TolA [Stutzerimonas stutzeri]MCQ4248900.1 cell envelope integrity protein TolA [Stutzerimonas stutzeri]PNG04416.1 cell envelope integrity protein TolA [Stutzerimonas stutzeri]
MPHPERSRSESLYWPTILAVGLHVIIFGMLFVSFAMTPELPPSKPIVQATLYQLKSQSQAKTQTNQKIAGEAQKTAAKQYETEQMEQRKVEQQKQAAAKAAEQKKADEARKAEAAKAEAAKKAAEVKKAEEAKQAEQKKQADIAKKKAADEAAKKKAAEEAEKKKAAEEAKKKAAAEQAKKKAAEDAKKKAAAEAAKKKSAEEAKKKAAAEAARKAAEDKKAQALAELLSDSTERQQAMADTQGDQVAGNFDDLIRLRAAEGWSRPPSARNNMSVTLQVNMLPDGTITSVTVSRSSGDAPFDNSAVAAVKNIGRLTEMQGLSAQDFQPYRSFKMTFTPEDLAL